jgi:NAD(P)-dependent dehydrogenase (short-subunit alcohol dehydrogenase family)
MNGFAPTDLAIIIGAHGGIGAALAEALSTQMRVLRLARATTPPLDLLSEPTIAAAAAFAATIGPPRLIIDATGHLHGAGFMPEKTFSALTPEHLTYSFAINAIGPALIMKHFLPLFPRDGAKSVFATLSAKVGSIGDNALGGWYSYRAAKAALNQLLHTAAIELRTKRPAAIAVALHPGTVDTPLSVPFAKTGLNVRPPADAAADILAVIDNLTASDSGGFFDYHGRALPW